MISVFIPGNPAPQGSKRHLGNGIMVESCKRVKPWRSDVRSHMLRHDGQPLAVFDGPVRVHLQFVMQRPKSTPKRSTPPAVKKPDLDKLQRAVFDAIGSAGVWRDDSQVTDVVAGKRLAGLDETPGVWVRVDAA